MRKRISADIDVTELEYAEPITLGDTTVTLHPSGHLLGSAQVRIECRETGEVAVVTGDFKVRPDRTCAPFELIPCDTFVTETTFALPIYRWMDEETISGEINHWWRQNAERDRTSVILTYALGKAQRVASLLDPSIGPIGAHGAVIPMHDIYRDYGVDLPEVVHANKDTSKDLKGSGLIIAPPSIATSPWIRKFAGKGGLRTGLASGWMAVRGRRRWRAVDRGFVLSDHADWPGLIQTVQATGATRIMTTHGYADTFARYIREEMGLEAIPVSTSYTGDDEESINEQTEEATA
jgi:putative mRNA 3-end processing factor